MRDTLNIISRMKFSLGTKETSASIHGSWESWRTERKETVRRRTMILLKVRNWEFKTEEEAEDKTEDSDGTRDHYTEFMEDKFLDNEHPGDNLTLIFH